LKSSGKIDQNGCGVEVKGRKALPKPKEATVEKSNVFGMRKSPGLLGLILISAVQANSASARDCYIGSNGEQYCLGTSDSSGYNPAPPHVPKALQAAQAHNVAQQVRNHRFREHR
jgi:hypothetical protein